MRLNIHDEETGKHRAVCEGVSLKEAEYIRLRENTKKKFEYLPKQDLSLKTFLTADGLCANCREVTGKREVGHRAFDAAHLVEFHHTPNQLDVKDASGYNFEEEDKVRAFFIPIERQDYRIKRDSENIDPSFREELKDKSQDIERPGLE